MRARGDARRGTGPKRGRRLAGAAVLIVCLCAPSGAAARSWRAPLPFGPAGAIRPDLAMLGNGALVGLWERPGRGAPPILEAAVKPSGQPFDDAQTLSSKAYESQVVGNDAGDALVVWESDPGVYAAWKPSGSSTFAPAQVVSATGARPQVAINSHGAGVVTFEEFLGNQEQLYAARVVGGTAATAQPVSGLAPQVGSGGVDFFKRDVVIDDAGQVVAVWQESAGEGIRANAATAEPGLPFSPPQTLSDVDRDGLWPNVAVDGSGAAVAAWVSTGRGGHVGPVMVAAKPALVPTFGTARQIGASGAGDNSRTDRVQVGASTGGDVVVAYHHETELPSTTPGQWSGSLGPAMASLGRVDGALPPAMALPNGATGSSWVEDKSLAMSPSGAAVVATRCCDAELQVTSRAPGGAFGAPEAIVCPAPSSAFIEKTAIDGAGDAAVLWAVGGDGLAYRLSLDGGSDPAAPRSCAGPQKPDSTTGSPYSPPGSVRGGQGVGGSPNSGPFAGRSPAASFTPRLALTTSRARLASTGRASFSVRMDRPASVVVRMATAARRGRAAVWVGRRIAFTRPGRRHVSLALSRAARTALRSALRRAGAATVVVAGYAVDRAGAHSPTALLRVRISAPRRSVRR